MVGIALNQLCEINQIPPAREQVGCRISIDAIMRAKNCICGLINSRMQWLYGQWNFVIPVKWPTDRSPSNMVEQALQSIVNERMADRGN